MTHSAPRPWVSAHCETRIQDIATQTSQSGSGEISTRIDALIEEQLRD